MVRMCSKCGKSGSDTGELAVWQCDCVEHQKDEQSQFMEDNWQSMRQYVSVPSAS